VDDEERLVPGGVLAWGVLGVDALKRVAADSQLGDLARLVGGVVQDLDFQLLARVLDLAHGVDQTVDDVHFVVEGQLDRHDRQLVERTLGNWLFVLVLHVEIHQVIPVPSVHGQNQQDEEV